jgi:hypothetical protein
MLFLNSPLLKYWRHMSVFIQEKLLFRHKIMYGEGESAREKRVKQRGRRRKRWERELTYFLHSSLSLSLIIFSCGQ